MKIYLNAKSESGIAYTPDWIKFSYKEDGEINTICCDIHGEISYTEVDLNCSCKAVLMPFVYYDKDANEFDLTQIDNKEIDKLIEKIFNSKNLAKIIEKSYLIEVGAFPAKSVGQSDEFWDTVACDTFSECMGKIDWFSKEEDINLSRTFKFDVEVNL